MASSTLTYPTASCMASLLKATFLPPFRHGCDFPPTVLRRSSLRPTSDRLALAMICEVPLFRTRSVNT